MGTMGRKDPWAGRPAPVESAMLPPGFTTLGKPLPLWAKQEGETIGSLRPLLDQSLHSSVEFQEKLWNAPATLSPSEAPECTPAA